MIPNVIKKRTSICLVSFFFVFFFNNTVFSQTLNSTGLQISVSPNNPKYNQNVTVQVSANSIDLNNSVITWIINGSIKKTGVGEKNLSFVTERAGKTSSVQVKVTTPQSEVFEETYIISPSEIDIIIEPRSFVPPFFGGRSTFVQQGSSKIVAISNIFIDGQKIPNNRLTYKWKKDGVVLQDSFGRGKDTITVNGSVPIKDIDISVEVYDQNSTLVGTGNTILSPYLPEIVFYEDNALYGKLFNRAITSNRNIGMQEEFNVIAYPFYFNILNETSNEIRYKWSVGGNNTKTTGAENTLLLRQTGSKGKTSISLKIEGVSRIFQYTDNSFSLQFGE